MNASGETKILSFTRHIRVCLFKYIFFYRKGYDTQNEGKGRLVNGGGP